MTAPMRYFPGAKSPFGPHTFRRCTEFCECYRWAATDLVPAMKFNRETERRECVNMIPRSA